MRKERGLIGGLLSSCKGERIEDCSCCFFKSYYLPRFDQVPQPDEIASALGYPNTFYEGVVFTYLPCKRATTYLGVVALLYGVLVLPGYW